MISSVIHTKLTAELRELLIEEENARRSVEETAAAGDFRENEPFQIAKAKFTEITRRIQEVRSLLSEEVQDVIGGSITLGRLLKIKSLGVFDNKGNLIEQENEEMILLFDVTGDCVVEGILSESCELGRLIKNGREGVYTINSGNSYRQYDVRFYIGDINEYFQRYPVSKKAKIEALLAGEIY